MMNQKNGFAIITIITSAMTIFYPFKGLPLTEIIPKLSVITTNSSTSNTRTLHNATSNAVTINSSASNTMAIHSSISNTTFLLGIFSTYNDTAFRNVIRARMLNESLPNYARQRICCLNDFLKSNHVTHTCHVIYTFVIGGNNSAYTILDPRQSLLINDSPTNVTEDDLTILNIHENMNHGKSPSWFYYASTLPASKIDYVSKMDADTFLSIPSLLDYIDNQLPNGDKLSQSYIYGGVKMDFQSCGGRLGRKRRCIPIKGKIYMAGQFYFISQPIVEMHDLWLPHSMAMDEDIDFALRLWTSNATISTILLNDDKFWKHGLKTMDSFSQFADEVVNASWSIHNFGLY
jgi:hypothetical protein